MPVLDVCATSGPQAQATSEMLLFNGEHFCKGKIFEIFSKYEGWKFF